MSSIITTPVVPEPQKAVKFTTTPEGSAITFVVGGDVYVSAAHPIAINTAITFTAVTDVVNPVLYAWDFGDGSIGHGAVVLHTYTIPNPHLRAQLEVTDAAGHQYRCGRQLYLEDDSGTPPTVVRF